MTTPIPIENVFDHFFNNEAIIVVNEEYGKIDFLQQELQIYLDLLNTIPYETFLETHVMLKPSYENINAAELKKKVKWFQAKKMRKELIWFLNYRQHIIGNKYKTWRVGDMGTRWIDWELNGRKCIVAFYHIETNLMCRFPLKSKECHKYILMIEPS